MEPVTDMPAAFPESRTLTAIAPNHVTDIGRRIAPALNSRPTTTLGDLAPQIRAAAATPVPWSLLRPAGRAALAATNLLTLGALAERTPAQILQTCGERADRATNIIARCIAEALAYHWLNDEIARTRESLDQLARALRGVASERHWRMYAQHVHDGQTLAVVGEDFGISRQRVSQIQKRVDQDLEATLQDSRFQPLYYRAVAVSSALGAAAPLGHHAPSLTSQRILRGASAETASMLGPVILRMAGPFLERNGWLTRPDGVIPGKRSGLNALLDEFGVMQDAAARTWLMERNVHPEFHETWLAESGTRRHGEMRLDWTGSVAGRSVAILAASNEPAETEALLALAGEGSGLQHARNSLHKDARLMRVGMNNWALRTWGLTEYRSITHGIAARIEASGGETNLKLIAREIADEFGVKERSVLHIAAAPMFVIEKGQVRLRREVGSVTTRTDLRHCARAFRIADHAVSLLVNVNNEMLRGSGHPLKRAVADLLGMTPGSTRRWSHPTGDIAVHWPGTSAGGSLLGSLRKAAMALEAGPGDQLRIEFDLARGRLHAERVPRPLAARGAEAIRLLTGIDCDLASAPARIAGAIDVAQDVVQRTLRYRGDTEIADIIAPSPDGTAMTNEWARLTRALDSAGLADSTTATYRAMLATWLRWCNAAGTPVINPESTELAVFVTESGLSIQTLRTVLSAIGSAHAQLDLPNPTRDRHVRQVLKEVAANTARHHQLGSLQSLRETH